MLDVCYLMNTWSQPMLGDVNMRSAFTAKKFKDNDIQTKLHLGYTLACKLSRMWPDDLRIVQEGYPSWIFFWVKSTDRLDGRLDSRLDGRLDSRLDGRLY